MTKLLVFSIVIMVLLIGCGGEGAEEDNADIENTIKGYFTTFNASDFNGCLTYFTGYEDEEDALAFLSFMRSLSGEIELREIKDIAIVPPSVPGSGSTATVTVVFTSAGEESIDQMELREVDSQWKIVWVEETPGPTPPQEPQQYPPIRTEGCLPSTVEVAPELQGVVEVKHCLWSDEEGQFWEALQVLNIGAQKLDLTAELYVYDSEGQELKYAGYYGQVAPGLCMGNCWGDEEPVYFTTTRYRIVVSSQ